jgi:hypothetical protein
MSWVIGAWRVDKVIGDDPAGGSSKESLFELLRTEEKISGGKTERKVAQRPLTGLEAVDDEFDNVVKQGLVSVWREQSVPDAADQVAEDDD